jgi:Fe-S cluster assembly scaffold IscU
MFLLKHTQKVVSRLGSTASKTSTASLFRSYHERVIDHYNNPRNVGTLPKDDPKVGTGLVGAPACGDVMRLQIRVNDKGIVEEAKFKTYGCGSAIASSSLASEWIKGKHVDEAVQIKNTEIAKHLSLPPVKLHCSMLAEDAIRAAIADWQKKQQVDAAQAAEQHQ